MGVSGCGGGSAEDFRTQVTQICVEYDELIRAVPAPTDNAQLVDSANEIARLIDEAAGRLRALDAPGDLEDDYQEWLRLNGEAAANAREISDAAGRDDRTRIRELAVLAERNEAEADELAEGLGLDACITGEEEGEER